MYGAERMDRERMHADWICDACSTMNFARRTECFKCSAPKGSASRHVPPADMSEERPVLIVKNLLDTTTEGSLLDAFGHFGQVRQTRGIASAPG